MRSQMDLYSLSDTFFLTSTVHRFCYLHRYLYFCTDTYLIWWLPIVSPMDT